MPATRPARVIAINKRQAPNVSRVLAGSSCNTLLAEVDESFGPSSLYPHSGTGGPLSAESCQSTSSGGSRIKLCPATLVYVLNILEHNQIFEKVNNLPTDRYQHTDLVSTGVISRTLPRSWFSTKNYKQQRSLFLHVESTWIEEQFHA